MRRSTHIPIAAGVSEQTRFAFREMIDARAVDICQPDPAIAGGISETQRICALAAANGLTVAPHLWGSAILFAAGTAPDDLHAVRHTGGVFARAQPAPDRSRGGAGRARGWLRARALAARTRAHLAARLRQGDHGGGIASRSARITTIRRAGPGGGGLPLGHAATQPYSASRWGHEIGCMWLRRSAEDTVPGGAPLPPAPPAAARSCHGEAARYTFRGERQPRKHISSQASRRSSSRRDV